MTDEIEKGDNEKGEPLPPVKRRPKTEGVEGDARLAATDPAPNPGGGVKRVFDVRAPRIRRSTRESNLFEEARPAAASPEPHRHEATRREPQRREPQRREPQWREPPRREPGPARGRADERGGRGENRPEIPANRSDFDPEEFAAIRKTQPSNAPLPSRRPSGERSDAHLARRPPPRHELSAAAAREEGRDRVGARAVGSKVAPKMASSASEPSREDVVGTLIPETTRSAADAAPPVRRGRDPEIAVVVPVVQAPSADEELLVFGSKRVTVGTTKRDRGKPKTAREALAAKAKKKAEAPKAAKPGKQDKKARDEAERARPKDDDAFESDRTSDASPEVDDEAVTNAPLTLWGRIRKIFGT